MEKGREQRAQIRESGVVRYFGQQSQTQLSVVQIWGAQQLDEVESGPGVVLKWSALVLLGISYTASTYL